MIEYSQSRAFQFPPPADLLSRRNAYAYPAVGLAGGLSDFRKVEFSSISAMEAHNSELLGSPEHDQQVIGYFSVLYWGHYGGQAGQTAAPRAFARVKLALNGCQRARKGVPEHVRGVHDLGVEIAAATLVEAASKVRDARFGEAALRLTTLPQINFAFASKICAFLCPQNCGVVDKVIVRENPEFDFRTDSKGYVRKNMHNVARYDDYCAMLSAKAIDLNGRGEHMKWVDRDGSRHVWRAVDIERALYNSLSS